MPNPVARPRAKPLATMVRRIGYGINRGFSDHSGRQGRIVSITPSVAHKKTKSSTPIRRSQRCAVDGKGGGDGNDRETEFGVETWGTDVLAGELISPTLGESLAKGSLGSEVIARVVLM